MWISINVAKKVYMRQKYDEQKEAWGFVTPQRHQVTTIYGPKYLYEKRLGVYERPQPRGVGRQEQTHWGTKEVISLFPRSPHLGPGSPVPPGGQAAQGFSPRGAQFWGAASAPGKQGAQRGLRLQLCHRQAPGRARGHEALGRQWPRSHAPERASGFPRTSSYADCW